MRRLAVLFLIILVSACAHAPEEPGGSLTAAEHMRLASIYESKGEIDLAVRHYERSIKAMPGKPDAHFALGNLNLKIGKYAEAERSYLKALSLDPKNGALYNNLGWLYMEMGDLTRAENMAKEAVKRESPNRFVFLDTLGVIQTRAGKYVEAEHSLTSAMEQATEGSAGLIKIYNHLLDLYRTTGDKAKAKEMEERLKAAF